MEIDSTYLTDFLNSSKSYQGKQQKIDPTVDAWKVIKKGTWSVCCSSKLSIYQPISISTGGPNLFFNITMTTLMLFVIVLRLF